ncbi:MAG: helix-hairpin-helix domain-containing protein [Burkholderiaceae bacterium]|nr:helix-hairpin-helix domain-containing protein [Burkholderiaceae bacterium]
MLKRILAILAFMYAAISFAAVDVNKASATELDAVKGIGPAISTKIIDERKKGSFKDWNDFIERVKGVGETNAAKFSAEGLTVNGAGFKGTSASAPAAAAKKDEKAAAKPAAAAPAAKDAKAEAKMKADADKKAKDEAKDKKAADKKAAADKKSADAKAAADKKSADAKAVADKKAADAKAAADKKSADAKAAADKKAATAKPAASAAKK